MPKLNQIVAASSYALTSVLILLFNKAILSNYSFKYPFSMALCHMVIGLIFLHTLKLARIITYAPFDFQLAKKALPVSLCFIANCVLGMVALKGTNIPMFATLRRLTVMMVVLCEVFILKKKQTMLVIASVSIMILGSFIGGWGDLQFDAFGYCMVLLNNLVTALNLVFIKKTLMDTKLASDTFGVLYYNSLLSIPFLLVCTVLSGEISGLPNFPYLYDPSFQAAFLISALMSFLMNYSTFWCTEVNSALTTSVTGQVKNVLSSFISFLMYGHGVGVQGTPLLITGLSVGLMGSFMYAYAIYKQDLKKKEGEKQQKEMTSSTELTNLISNGNGYSTNNNHTMNGNGYNPISVDLDLSSLTDGVVNQLHTPKGAVERHPNEQLSQAEMDAKIGRLEAGQRSPMPHLTNNINNGHPSSVVPLIHPNPSNRGSSLSSSPNPLHPLNQPHKSKPN